MGYDSLYYTVVKGLDFGLHELKTDVGKFMATCVGAAIEETYCFTVTTSLEAIRDTVVLINATICDNEEYYFAGHCLDKTGIYYDTLYSPNWRDSIVELHLTVNPSYEYITDTVMPYWSSLSWREHQLTNIIHDTLIIDSLQTTISGCDSIYILNLTAQCAKVDTFVIDTAICANDWPYIWHTYRDIEIDKSGTYIDTMRGLRCDSLSYILRMNELRADSTDTTIFACKNDLPYHWNEYELTADGIYVSKQTNKVGCDSVTTLTFYITSFCEPTKPIDPTIDCIDTTYSTIDTTFIYDSLQAHPFVWFDKEYTEPGLYTDTLVGANYVSCDSIGSLLLRVTYQDSLLACADEQVTFHTPWGNYTSIPDSDCISRYPIVTDDNEWLVSLSLCVYRQHPVYAEVYRQVKEEELPYLWNDFSLPIVPFNEKRDTTAVFTTPAASGCDSITTLFLHVLEPCEVPSTYIPVWWKK